jgi:hypothetical protein
MSPSHPRFNDHLGIALTRRSQNCVVKGASCEDPVVNNTATRITSIRGTKTWGRNTGDSFGTNGVSGYANEADWTVRGVSAGTSLEAVQSPWQNTSTTGARLCYRWGTTTPLWPWPMAERIKAATLMAGRYGDGYPASAIGCDVAQCQGSFPNREEFDLTATIEKLLGPIPAQCR